MRLVLAVLAFYLLALPVQAQPVCGNPAAECPTANGFYRLALPDGAAGPVPALVFLHGWGSSSKATMKNKAMLATLAARGYALIAPEGIRTSATRTQKNWAVRDGRDRVLLAGFSRGASMVWDIACQWPGLARAYAPVAGAFWEPLQESCRGGADLFHTHGWADRVIPLEGRSVAGGALTQGDTFVSLKILRAANGCETEQPNKSSVEAGNIWRRSWSSCRNGRIDLMLHPGPHGVPKFWLSEVLDWFELRQVEG